VWLIADIYRVKKKDGSYSCILTLQNIIVYVPEFIDDYSGNHCITAYWNY